MKTWITHHWSPVTVTALAAGMALMVVVDWSALIVVVPAVACAVVALGWPRLTGIPMSLAAYAVAAGAGVAAAVVTAATHNFADVASVLGVGLALTVLVALFFGPAPRDHSRLKDGRLPNRAVSAQASAHLASSMDAAQPSAQLGSRAGRARASGAAQPGPLLLGASAVCAMVSGVSAACWVALADSPAWAPLTLAAGVIVTATAWGDQCGRSYRANSWGAVIAGGVVGLAFSALPSIFRGGLGLPLVFGAVGNYLGTDAAVGLLGLVTGLCVACSVVAVDGLLGDHQRQQTALGQVARGCIKFLVAAVPVYAMIRVGAL